MINYNLFQLGCGGTGGYLALPLSKFVKHLPPNIHVTYTLIDGDVVEDRNVLRQNFTNDDIGSPKAEILGERYGLDYLNMYVTKDNAHELVVKRPRWVNVYLGCMDSVKARMDIRRALFKLRHPCILIDGGNAAQHGQVYVEEHDTNICVPTCPNLNNIFKGLGEMDSAPTCSALGDQSIQANYMVAMYMYNIVTELITTNKITTTSIEFSRYTMNANTNMAVALTQGTL